MTSGPAARARGEARQAASSEWVDKLGKVGLVAKAALYAIVGVLALRIAFGDGGDADSKGALEAVADQPLGTALLVALAAGFAGYGLWRLAQGVRGDRGEDESGLKRLRYPIEGVVYLALAATTVGFLMGGGSGQGTDETSQSFTARVLEWPLGVPLVIAVGLVIAGVGLYQAKDAVSGRLMRRLRTERMSHGEQSAAEWVGRVGLLARAVVFCLIGWFLVNAALDHDPDDAKGIDGALKELAEQGHGPWLLAIVAAGLVAYAAWCLAEARWHRDHTSRSPAR